MTTEDEALREARKQVGEMYLASHLEKHDLEQTAADTALAHAMQRVDDHQTAHEIGHASHQQIHDTAEKAHDHSHAQEQLAVRTALEAVARERTIHADAHAREHLNHAEIHTLAQLAVDKAELAIESRLHSMNEVRDQMRDREATYVRLDAFDTFKDERRSALTALDSSIDTRLEGLRNLIATEREERREMMGTRKGISQSTAIVVGAIGLAATIISVVIVIANFATGTP